MRGMSFFLRPIILRFGKNTVILRPVMYKNSDRPHGVLASLDWVTIAIYLMLLTMGWISVCGATYSFAHPDIFSMETRSGMQLLWIGTSLALALVVLLLDDRVYDMFAYVIYALLLLLLVATIFNPHSIKGSHSWLVLGPLRLQPAEFAKFATALALGKLMSVYGFNLRSWRDLLSAIVVIVLPMAAIVLQRETGSALVYLSLFLVLYREGMTGNVLFLGLAAVLYFVIGIRFAGTLMPDDVTSVGRYVVLWLIQVFTAAMTATFIHDWQRGLQAIALCMGVTLVATLFSTYVIPFDVAWVQYLLLAGMIGWLVWMWAKERLPGYVLAAAFALGSVAFYGAADYTLNHVLEPHQRVRINVLLGLEEDLAGAGYNVHQSEIAIGSGGLRGKGFLNGTQTKLKFVPEQETDFIFCTVGEEEGFVGSAGVLLLFLALILRLIHLAERQPTHFGRVYGYSVVSILLFHVTINVGMVLGLMPVIGIPLPFFSYGGSSLWGFTLLLFIFLRIDAGRSRAADD